MGLSYHVYAVITFKFHLFSNTLFEFDDPFNPSGLRISVASTVFTPLHHVYCPTGFVQPWKNSHHKVFRQMVSTLNVSDITQFDLSLRTQKGDSILFFLHRYLYFGMIFYTSMNRYTENIVKLIYWLKYFSIFDIFSIYSIIQYFQYV